MIHILFILLFVVANAAAEPLYPIPPHQAKKIEGAAPATPQAEPKVPRRVLLWLTPKHLMPKDPHKGYCIPYGAHAFTALGRKTGAYEAVESDDLANFLPGNIGEYDAIVMNNSSGAWITPSEGDMKREAFRNHGATAAEVERVLRDSLFDYVHRGGGIVGVHYAIGANRQWLDFAPSIFGASFDGHPWNEEIGVRVEEPDHPLLSGFEGLSAFRVADEIFQFKEPYDRSKLRVLLSIDAERTNMGVKWIRRTDGDFALAWVRPLGKGRVFYSAIGHRTEIYWNPQILQLYLDGVQYATGDLEAADSPNGAGFIPLFNGKDLTGWEGDPRIWSVREGILTGETTKDVSVAKNDFLIWKGGAPRDFELRLQYRLIGGNSGIYFHAEKDAPGAKGETLVGPQADISADHRWTGVLMEWRKRDILAERGQKVVIDERGARKVVGSHGNPTELLKSVRDNAWNDYRVIVRGKRVVLEINGVKMSEVEDNDPRRTVEGFLALQVHKGPPMKVEFRDIWLRQH